MPYSRFCTVLALLCAIILPSAAVEPRAVECRTGGGVGGASPLNARAAINPDRRDRRQLTLWQRIPILPRVSAG